MSDVVEVVQVVGAASANKTLAEGWKLLAVVPNANNAGVSHVAYVLGKPAEKTGTGLYGQPV
ncbi:hypothetical protein ACXM5Z_13755 [Pseudomonas piscis]